MSVTERRRALCALRDFEAKKGWRKKPVARVAKVKATKKKPKPKAPKPVAPGRQVVQVIKAKPSEGFALVHKQSGDIALATIRSDYDQADAIGIGFGVAKFYRIGRVCISR